MIDNNHCADLFSEIFRKFENLKPNKLYSTTFNIDFASNALISEAGVGQDPVTCDIDTGASML